MTRPPVWRCKVPGCRRWGYGIDGAARHADSHDTSGSLGVITERAFGFTPEPALPWLPREGQR